MIKPEEIKRLIDFIYDAHQNHNAKNDFRQNGRVPFFVHPTWCALMLLNDQRISFEERQIGYQALLLHDVLEDTSLPIPEWVDKRVVNLVKEMTHETWEEEKDIGEKPNSVKLLKLCDKSATMYDESIRPDPVRRKEWKELTQKLLKDVEDKYGNIRLVQVGKAVIDNTDW